MPRRGRNDENRNFRERGTRRVAPTASPAQRVAVGEEEQGSGRMTSFCAAGIKRRRSKADFAPTWCKRGDSNSHGGCHTHLKRACLPIPTLLRLPYSLVIIANAAVLVNTFFDRTAGSYEQLCGVPTGLSLALRISCAGLRSRSLLGKIANMSLTANSISSIIKPIENARHRRA